MTRYLLAAACLVALFVLPRGVWSAVIAGLFFALFLMICRGYRRVSGVSDE